MSRQTSEKKHFLKKLTGTFLDRETSTRYLIETPRKSATAAQRICPCLSKTQQENHQCQTKTNNTNMQLSKEN